jgi:hypothetical protein
VESSCELGNEPSGSIKCWETTECLHKLWPLEWYSSPQSLLNQYQCFRDDVLSPYSTLKMM